MTQAKDLRRELSKNKILEDAAKWVDIIAPPAPPYVAGSFKRRQDATVDRLTVFLDGLTT